MPKATSVKPGTSGSATRKAGSTDRKADKVVESARTEAERVRREANADAARIRQEAEEHARRLILDAHATAEGVRAEGMEVVSNLRQISEVLGEMAERVLEDVQAIHARWVGQLERVGVEPVAEAPAEGEAAAGSSSAEELDVPDFVQHH